MPARTSLLSLLCAMLVLVLRGAAAETSLPKDSPFLPLATPSAAAGSNEAYEFAAVSTIGKDTSVNIYDKQAKKGKWIPVGQTVDGITVTNYNVARDEATVRIGGSEKVLALRKGGTPLNGRATGGVSAVQLPATTNIAPAPVAPSFEPAKTETNVATGVGATATTPAVAQPPPPKPGTVAHQEQEARMLVSDLLEIGMAQRKAYEEAQKKAVENNNAPAAQTPQPPTTAPAPTGN